MKEKIIIIVLCCILITVCLFNARTGPECIHTDIIPEETVVYEEQYIVSKKEDGEYEFCLINQEETDKQETQELKLYALSACMMDAKTGRVLYGKNHIEPRAMASTTKILTCLLALENCSLDDTVTVSEYAASMPDVQLNMSAGEEFRLYDLLLSLMLESHNDTAVAIAEHVGGSVDEFCRMMTERAGQIGCVNSVFLTPNGLDKEKETEEGLKKHSTTAQELAMIMRECIKNEQFVTICKTKNAMISNIAKSKTYRLNNHNALLNTMNGVIAGKTGFTCDAGYCYVGAVERNGNVYICTLLGCGWPNNKNYKWQDMNTLISHADKSFVNLSLQDIPNKSKQFEAGIIDGIRNNKQISSVPLVVEDNTDNNVDTLVLKEGEKIDILYEFPKIMYAPIEKSEEIGSIYYTINGQILKKENLTVSDDINKLKYTDLFGFVLDRYFLVN